MSDHNAIVFTKDQAILVSLSVMGNKVLNLPKGVV